MVVCVTVNGKMLSDSKDSNGTNEVKLPFGSEYGIYFRNLHSERATIKVSIDGKDVLNGQKVVLNPNEVHVLEGELTASNVKNKFKFIEKTTEISNFRGDKPEDGLIVIQFQYELPKEKFIFPKRWNGAPHVPYHEVDHSSMPYNGPTPSMGTLRGMNIGGSLGNSETLCFSNCAIPPANDNGITVKGSDTNVAYTSTYMGRMESDVSTYVVRLAGYSKDTKVVEPITVKTKKVCPTCGRQHKQHIKFCNGCGTNIQ